jgi:hypothetical protein
MSALITPSERRTRADGLALAFLLASLCLLAWRLWGRWGSLRTDCGHEVYVPASILRGRLLYRDLWYPWGPLAPYLEAGLLRVFGLRLEVLYALGLATTAACLALLFSISRRFLSTLPAFVVALAFLLQALRPELFNFVFPYGYAAPIACLLGFLFLHSLLRRIQGGAPRHLVHAALAAALALLTKIEFGVACVATLGLALLLQARLSGNWQSFKKDLLRCLPAALLVIAGYGVFVSKTSLSFILFENFNSFPGSIFMKSYGAAWVRLQGLRFDPPELLASGASIALVLVAWLVLGRLLAWGNRSGRVALALLFGAGLLALAMPHGMNARRAANAMLWLCFPISMFWLTPLLAAREALRCVRRQVGASVELTATSIFGTLLGSRVMLAVRPRGYPIFYSALLFMVFMIWIGRVIGNAPRVSRALALLHAGVLGVLLMPHAPAGQAPLSTDIGTIYGNQVDVARFRRISGFMRRQSRHGDRIVVLPEETLLYVLAGVEAPTRWYQTTPGIMGPEQEQEYLRLMERARVDYIIVTNHANYPYGVPFFGLDYHQRIYEWLLARYEPVREFGKVRPGEGSPLAARLYRLRRSPPE